jgi:(p)ppGpp synthase/HD superfamily hydrolase
MKELHALQIAWAVHQTQVDKSGVPYIRHVMRVGEQLADPLDRIVGFLHDAIEDGPKLAPPDRPFFDIVGHDPVARVIEQELGSTIRDLVRRLTRREGEDYCDDYLVRVCREPVTRRVKRADCIDNMSRLSQIPDATERERLAKKYNRAFALEGYGTSRHSRARQRR